MATSYLFSMGKKPTKEILYIEDKRSLPVGGS